MRAERYPDEHAEPGSPAYQVDRGWWLLADPARVLAECEAKRLTVAHLQSATKRHEGAQRGLAQRGADDREACEDELASWRVLDTMQCVAGHLAQPYADHPDYDDEWRKY